MVVTMLVVMATAVVMVATVTVMVVAALEGTNGSDGSKIVESRKLTFFRKIIKSMD